MQLRRMYPLVRTKKMGMETKSKSSFTWQRCQRENCARSGWVEAAIHLSRFPPLEPSGHFSGEVQSSRLLPHSSQARTQERPRKRRNGRGESPCQQRTMNRLVFLPGRCSAPKDCSCLQTQILPPADSTGCCRCFQCCQRQPGRSSVKVNVSLLKSF